MKPTYRIGLLNALLNTANMGCNALGYSALKLFSEVENRLGVQFTYTLFSFESPSALEAYKDLPGDAVRFCPPHFGARRAARALLRRRHRELKALQAAIRDCDLVAEVAGGDSFSDIYGCPRLTQICRAHRRFRHRPLIFLPQTIGPFASAAARRPAGASLEQASVVFARDPLSREEAARYVPADRIATSLDMAFFMGYAPRASAPGRSVALNPSGLLYRGGYTGNNQFGLKADYPVLLESIIEQLLAEGCEVTLLAHVLRGPEYHVEDDYRVCRLLQQKYPACRLAPYFYSPVEAKSFISGFDFVIASRMHCCIAAYSSGVPVYPLSYSRKFEGLFGEGLNYRWLSSLATEGNDHILAALAAALGDLDHMRNDMPRRLQALEHERIALLDRLSAAVAEGLGG